MIMVTRLNATEFAINAELVESVEATPDTVISLTTGKKLVVKESVGEIITRIKEYRASIGMLRYMENIEQLPL